MSELLAYHSANELIAKLRAGDVGVLELVDCFIDRIESLDQRINAIPVRDFQRARDTARNIDRKKMSDRGPLCGLPITVKESYNVAGLPTTWGIEQFLGFEVEQDAEIVRRYKEAGAIILGKSNVPKNLADFQSYNAHYGTTNNPWDIERTPGGSSGGAAAALAAGFSALETGSDIGGSIRNPAHFCGVYGHKPTWDVVPPQGHALPGSLAAPDIAVCGPLARSAADLALAMDILAGPQPLQASAWQLNMPRPTQKKLSDFRVAMWIEDDKCPVDRETVMAADNVASALRQAGATVSVDARPDINVERSHVTYMTLMHSIMGASVEPELFEKSQRKAGELASDDRSDTALTTRGMVALHKEWLQANNFRERLRYQWQAFFKQWDVLICPQMATAAFKHDHSDSFSGRTIDVDGVERPYFEQVFWSGLITTPYLPSTVFPAGRTVSQPAPNLPIGLQAVSAEYHDYITIEFTRLLAEEIGGFCKPHAL